MLGLGAAAGYAGQGTEKNDKKQVPLGLARLLQGNPEDFIKRFEAECRGRLGG